MAALLGKLVSFVAVGAVAVGAPLPLSTYASSERTRAVIAVPGASAVVPLANQVGFDTVSSSTSADGCAAGRGVILCTHDAG